MKIPKLVRAFIAGSAFPVVAIPFLLLTGMSVARDVHHLNWWSLVWMFPLVIGAANVLFWSIQDKIKLSYTAKLWLFGVVLGVIMPTGGIANNVPHEVFGFPADQQFLIYPLAMLFYGLIWRYAIEFMNQVVEISHLPKK